jgi:hypothetical protein
VRPAAAVFLFFHAIEPELEWRIVGLLRRILRFQRRLVRWLIELERRFAIVERRWCQRRRFDARRALILFFFTRLIRWRQW